MPSIYPQSFGDWVASAPVAGGAAAWLWTAFSQARVARSARREAEWRRLHELADIVHHGGQYGHWRQILAARELSRLRTLKPDVRWLAGTAADFYEANRANSATDEFVMELRATSAGKSS